MTITPEDGGPYRVRDVDSLVTSDGRALATQPEMVLCGCGRSRRKPFCDGAHEHARDADVTPQDRDTEARAYVGREITIYDSAVSCARSGQCSRRLPDVFRPGQTPWIEPDGANPERILAIVRTCPSGALDAASDVPDVAAHAERPTIFISQDGPYHVSGAIALRHARPTDVPASARRYALCRCGHSARKPFCDGSHWIRAFVDDAN